jgi:hypothetical protein
MGICHAESMQHNVHVRWRPSWRSHRRLPHLEDKARREGRSHSKCPHESLQIDPSQHQHSVGEPHSGYVFMHACVTLTGRLLIWRTKPQKYKGFALITRRYSGLTVAFSLINHSLRFCSFGGAHHVAHVGLFLHKA